MPVATTAGYVLAGGKSSRMGSDKAALPWRGASLIEAVAAEVLAAAGSVAIVGGPPRAGLRVVPDEFPGFGPTGGIATALADSQAHWTLIVACDMPALQSTWLRTLLDSAAGDVLVPRTSDGRIHPLCAVWRNTAATPMREAVREGVHTVREAIGRLDCRWFDTEDARAVSNVNTPEEWLRLRE